MNWNFRTKVLSQPQLIKTWWISIIFLFFIRHLNFFDRLRAKLWNVSSFSEWKVWILYKTPKFVQWTEPKKQISLIKWSFEQILVGKKKIKNKNKQDEKNQIFESKQKQNAINERDGNNVQFAWCNNKKFGENRFFPICQHKNWLNLYIYHNSPLLRNKHFQKSS